LGTKIISPLNCLGLGKRALMVIKEWWSISHGNSPMDKWQNKIRHLRSFVRGWAKNISNVYKKERDRLLALIDMLDKKAEINHLSNAKRDSVCDANDKLASLRRDEETKWAQRAKVKHVQEGGNNTKYFHLIANGKHRRKNIFKLEQEEDTIVGEDNLKFYISEYYKSLFDPPIENNFSMTESVNSDIPKLSHQENGILIAEFTYKEVHDAIMKMKKSSRS
jgi:hypothetical protein